MVKAQYRGNRAVGLYVGTDNARRYFPKRARLVELQLDHLRILCGLTSHFWQDMPEIQDSRLSLWLETKLEQADRIQTEIPLTLIPSGRNSFRLRAMERNASARLVQAEVDTAQTLIA